MVFVGAMVMVSSTALATPTNCVTGSLASYELLNPTGGCVIDNLLFDNFSDQESAAGLAVALTANAITVTPDFVSLDEGLQFSASWNVSTPSSMDSVISFTVQTVNGKATLGRHKLERHRNTDRIGQLRCDRELLPRQPESDESLPLFLADNLCKQSAGEQ